MVPEFKMLENNERYRSSNVMTFQALYIKCQYAPILTSALGKALQNEAPNLFDVDLRQDCCMRISDGFSPVMRTKYNLSSYH